MIRRAAIQSYRVTAKSRSSLPRPFPISTTSFVLPDPIGTKNSHSNHVGDLQLTKIVATVGPTSEQAEPLLLVSKAGMRVMRLNFSHATPEEVELRCTNLAAAQVSARTGKCLAFCARLLLS
jgi:hypothetical protein